MAGRQDVRSLHSHFDNVLTACCCRLASFFIWGDSTGQADGAASAGWPPSLHGVTVQGKAGDPGMSCDAQKCWVYAVAGWRRSSHGEKAWGKRIIEAYCAMLKLAVFLLLQGGLLCMGRRHGASTLRKHVVQCSKWLFFCCCRVASFFTWGDSTGEADDDWEARDARTAEGMRLLRMELQAHQEGQEPGSALLSVTGMAT